MLNLLTWLTVFRSNSVVPLPGAQQLEHEFHDNTNHRAPMIYKIYRGDQWSRNVTRVCRLSQYISFALKHSIFLSLLFIARQPSQNQQRKAIKAFRTYFAEFHTVPRFLNPLRVSIGIIVYILLVVQQMFRSDMCWGGTSSSTIQISFDEYHEVAIWFYKYLILDAFRKYLIATQNQSSLTYLFETFVRRFQN